ncbi:MAG TPA: hypothetical protein VIL90_09315, partial [Puia sp.]
MGKQKQEEMIAPGKFLFVFLSATYIVKCEAQSPEISDYRNRQLETLAEKKNAEPEDDAYEMDLSAFRKHPLNMNTASEEDLIQLHIPGVFQIRNFISYRKLLGSLL